MSAFVRNLYAINPYAIKNPTDAEIAFWEAHRAQYGDATTANTFHQAVANVTGTPVWSPGKGSAVTSRMGGLLPLLLVGGVVVWLVMRRRKK